MKMETIWFSETSVDSPDYTALYNVSENTEPFIVTTDGTSDPKQ
jgi:hypothetical protein